MLEINRTYVEFGLHIIALIDDSHPLSLIVRLTVVYKLLQVSPCKYLSIVELLTNC